MSTTQRRTSGTTGTREEGADGFTAEERAAIKERAQEVRAGRRRATGADGVDPDAEVRAKIAELPEPDRAMATRVHEIVRAHAPSLTPRLWYGMPAYAKDGKVLCFFQPASKFKARYATLGFNDVAQLDDGGMWPAAFALVELGQAEEQRVRELVVRACG
ncbi:iron chaperone [Cellulomonas soli]|uniref:iron chaperone n=1 Tax=Cellulomonas soli TaxID=931535 RepID=UPI003F85C43A